MKKIMFLLPAVIIIMLSQSAFSQKYKTAADTAKLNKEYVEVSNEIADLTSRLTIAQNNLPGYNNKANDAKADAQNTAIKSSEQSSDAVNGDVGDAKKAKRKAKKALREAKHARQASNKAEDQDKKIASLSSQLQKKQERLRELDTMRAAILNSQ
ncbi:MAG: hypothetical protein ACR2KX_05705 [Chitinophagaceae bacterium]